MRFGQVAPVFFGIFVSLACGGNADESKVGGTGATGNNGTGNNGTGNDLNTSNGATTGNPGGGYGSVVDPTTACTSTSADCQAVQVDLYFMVDTTGSMNCPVPDNGVRCDMPDGPPATGESRWSVVSAALKVFVVDPKNKGLGVGLRFFPSRNNACDENSYARPNVEIGPLSMTSQPLTTAINMQTPDGSTPTVPSLNAAINHATIWAKAHPTHRVAVVYATDGQPNGCRGGNTVPLAAAAALRGAMSNPSIPTYVLGVGPDLANLNSIAEAGGTQAAFLVDTSQNAAAQLSTALASIRSTTALDCVYSIPAPPAGDTLDPSLVNVEYTSSTGAVTRVLQDPPMTTCAAGSGWQYSTDMTQILLCGKACNDVKADKGGKIQVLFGCQTKIGDPPK